MSPRRDVSVERTQQIYQAALACFARNGYHLTTMDDIAHESSLSKGTLYWYFKGKKELFLSLFQETMEQFSATWDSSLADRESSARDKMLASIAFFRHELEDLVPFFGIMMEAWALTRHDEQVENLAREFYRPYLEIMTGIIEEGVANGEFEVRAAESTALVIMTLFDGVILALGTGLATQDWGSLMDAAETLILHGLGAKGSHHAL